MNCNTKCFHDPPLSHMLERGKCLGMVQSLILKQIETHNIIIDKSLNLQYSYELEQHASMHCI
jgi:hypothetical protein